MNITFLICQLKKDQQLLLGTIFQKVLESVYKYKQNNHTCSLTKIPTTEAYIQKIFIENN